MVPTDESVLRIRRPPAFPDGLGPGVYELLVTTLRQQEPVSHAAGVKVESADGISRVVRNRDGALTAPYAGAGNIEGSNDTVLGAGSRSSNADLRYRTFRCRQSTCWLRFVILLCRLVTWKSFYIS